MLVDLHEPAGGDVGGPHRELFEIKEIDLLPIIRHGHGEHPVVNRDPRERGIGGRGKRDRDERGDEADENGPRHPPTLTPPQSGAAADVEVFSLQTRGVVTRVRPAIVNLG